MASSFIGGCWNEARDETDGGNGVPLKHDPAFRGPIRGKSRRPKDLICLGVFIAFIIGMFAIAIVAWVDGEPERLIYPTDSRGRLCGVHDAVRDKPFLLFFDIKQCATVVSVSELLAGEVDTDTIFTCPTQQINCLLAHDRCVVAECPEENEFGVRNNPVCVDEVDPDKYRNVTDLNSFDSAGLIADLVGDIANERCAPYYLRSEAVARRCIPTFLDLRGIVNDTINFEPDPALNDTLIREVLTSASIDSIVMDHFSGFSYYQFYCFQDTENLFNRFDSEEDSLTDFLNSTETLSARLCVQTEVFRSFISSQLPWFRYQKETWLAIGIIGTVFVVVIVLILIFLGKKIRISIAIIQEAAKAVGGVPTSVFYPVLTWLLLIMLFLYWAVVAVFLLTASTPTYRILATETLSVEDRTISELSSDPLYNGDICDIDEINALDLEEINNASTNGRVLVDTTMGVLAVYNGSREIGRKIGNISCLFDEFVTSNTLLGMHIYHLFGLLWIGNYILALGECTLAGAFASWYWAYRKPKDVPLFAVLGSLGRAFLFHSGSLAFGALIIAIIQMIRIILAYLQRKLKDKTGRITKIIFCILQCCFWLLEKFFKYVNRQAYIEIAIYGYDFCTGACKAVKLMIRNLLTTAVKDRIVAFLLFLGKIFIVCVIGVLAYLGFGPYQDQGEKLWGQPLNYYLIPVMVLVTLAYFIASGFMSVFHMAVDTIFICALEDYERNDGTEEKPYFMSDNLKKLLGVKNKFDRTDGTDGAQLAEVSGGDKLEPVDSSSNL
ncbi:Choline transporter-like protein 4 [Geodia barretti]|uniref:Choline transporter-like protein n=1 Tax=Geodia barretti TaxID=519541 RepID=A0AA35WJQ1_GEOBA|nr:Choline transporter-like protein 4 [Geodia barretti]